MNTPLRVPQLQSWIQDAGHSNNFINIIINYAGVLVVQGDSSPYGPWTEWSECSVDKGQGVMSRTRACVAVDCPQPGEYEDVMACFVIPCPCECPLAHTGGM